MVGVAARYRDIWDKISDLREQLGRMNPHDPTYATRAAELNHELTLALSQAMLQRQIAWGALKRILSVLLMTVGGISSIVGIAAVLANWM